MNTINSSTNGKQFYICQLDDLHCLLRILKIKTDMCVKI